MRPFPRNVPQRKSYATGFFGVPVPVATGTFVAFSLAPILTIPVATGLPLFFGQALDVLSFMEADGCRLLFVFCAGFILVTLYFSVQTDYEGATADPKE